MHIYKQSSLANRQESNSAIFSGSLHFVRDDDLETSILPIFEELLQHYLGPRCLCGWKTEGGWFPDLFSKSNSSNSFFTHALAETVT